MEHTRYYAMLGADSFRENPTGVSRRRIVDGVSFDEVYTRNHRWEPTEYFALYMLGHNEIEHVEIDKAEAEAFIEKISGPDFSIDEVAEGNYQNGSRIAGGEMVAGGPLKEVIRDAERGNNEAKHIDDGEFGSRSMATTSLHGRARRLRAVPVLSDVDRALSDDQDLEDIPDDVRKAARSFPNHWLDLVDPLWDDDQNLPEWAIVGGWRSDEDGEVAGWAVNPDYRPSPAMLNWDEPEDLLDAAVQLAATGYGPTEEVARLLAATEVAVLVDAAGSPVAASTPDGTAVIPAFTSQPHVDKMGAFRHQVIAVTQLVDQIPKGHLLYLNPAGPVGFAVETDSLLHAIGQATE
ncbi:type VII secretion system-associated protein [Streptomyces sp. NPDC088354]|uniref:type VII secretion system-associated protein n=1 Tax=Streptomyces sp. NPDC088354 TaxID=3365856 RepID=UPI00382E432D